MKIESLAEYIDNRLELKLFEHLDASMNGLQVGRPEKEVKKIAFSVDSTLETFLKAAQWGADALFVHHGLFWGKPLAITKNHYNRIATLLRYDIALLAAHLPLDAHPELGNNATMASMLELQELESFGYYHGVDIGYAGRFNEAVSVEHIVKTLGFTDEGGLKILPFGKKEIKSVGIVSGGAASQVLEAIEKGFDAFITGECSHTMYPYCMESEITMICGGHYATEIFGVQQLAKELSERFDLETLFIEAPTSL